MRLASGRMIHFSQAICKAAAQGGNWRWFMICKEFLLDYKKYMRIIAIATLKAFWESTAHADAKSQLLVWCQIAKKADWSSPADIKAEIRSVSILQDGRAIFNIAGNKYRLVVWINYSYRIIYIRFIGTHAQYDAIDPQTI